MIRLMFLGVLSLFVALTQADEPPPVKEPPPAFLRHSPVILLWYRQPSRRGYSAAH